jgi:pimeloyl-ACP methyl ester carboxylesterase
MLGYDVFGSGPRSVLSLNDWVSDTSSWDGARAYLDGEAFRWVFADLRGYGRSIEQRGAYTVAEAAGDVLQLADALDLREFALVGHSMSALIALHLAQQPSTRVSRAVLITPPPPGGLGMDDAGVAGMEALGGGDDAHRLAALRSLWGDRLGDGWARYKTRRWRQTADAQAAAAYQRIFTRDGVPSPRAPVSVPVLAIAGEQDLPPMRSDAVRQAYRGICKQLTVSAITDSAHYPMQETPPLLASLVQRFLAAAD